MRVTYAFVSLLLLDAIFLVLASSSLSIGKHEAEIFFEGSGYLKAILDLSVTLLGQNDFALRAPFILLHLVNTILLYQVSREVVRRPEDLLLVAMLFLMLPGVNTAALIVSKTGVIIFLTLTFVRLFQLYGKHAYYLLIPMAFVDNAFLYLFVSLMFFGHYRKESRMLFFSILAFSISYYFYGFDLGEEARGYFLDIFSIYAAIFSPFVFIFFIYALYWQFVKANTRLPVMWFIAAVAFLISIILSLRQNIRIEDFAPYAVIFVPYMVFTFYNSYRIRLPEFRKVHKVVFATVMVTLVLNTVTTFFNKPLYLLMSNPKRHFAYEHHFTKDLAAQLKSMGIKAVECDSATMQKKLRFYGIDESPEYRLEKAMPLGVEFEKISFTIFGQEIEYFFIYKAES